MCAAVLVACALVGLPGVGGATGPGAVGATAPLPPPVSPATEAGPAPAAPEAFTTLTRSAAQQLWESRYLAAADSAIGWNGSTASCSAGTTTAAFKAGVLARINYFRAMAGVPDVALSATYNANAQSAALMMAANSDLSHDPPTSWNCYTAAGADAAGNSNLSLGNHGAAAVFSQMRDAGSGNTAVGHRRWILFPATQTMGTGDVVGADWQTTANALWVFDDHLWDPLPPTREEYVAWPPPGYVPYPVIFPRFSFSLEDADFSGATVTMTRNGASLPLTVRTVATFRDLATLVWEPQQTTGHSDVYQVSISGVVVGGVSRNFAYTVRAFDPDDTAPTVNLRSPANGATVARGATVVADYDCADEAGGSGLASCAGPVADGAAIDTATLGARPFTVTGVDGAGNRTDVTHTYTVVDVTDPTVTVTSPAAGAVFVQGASATADYACADEAGGSGLASCTGTVPDGAAIDTSALGTRPFSVTGIDHAGNDRVVDRPYQVTTRPDALVAASTTAAFVGDGRYASRVIAGQTATGGVARGATRTFRVRVGNDGGMPASFTVQGVTSGSSGYTVRFVRNGVDITSAVTSGAYGVPDLAPGAVATIKVKVTARTTAAAGSARNVDVTIRSAAGPAAVDVVRARATRT